jgi:hypothetical protein
VYQPTQKSMIYPVLSPLQPASELIILSFHLIISFKSDIISK